MHGGRERNGGAGHAGDARAPDPAGHDHRLGPDVSTIRTDASDVAVLHVDAGHLHVGEGAQSAQLLCFLAHERAGPERIDHADTRCGERAEDDLLLDERDQVSHVARGEQLDRFHTP